MMDDAAAQIGLPPVSPSVRQAAFGISLSGDDAAGFVTEEIATMRLLLRNVYKRALLALDTSELLHLLDLYGKGCTRLAKLEKLRDTGDSSRLANYMKACLDKAIREVHQELRSSMNDNQVVEPGL
jgi:hypothetical protein